MMMKMMPELRVHA